MGSGKYTDKVPDESNEVFEMKKEDDFANNNVLVVEHLCLLFRITKMNLKR